MCGSRGLSSAVTSPGRIPRPRSALVLGRRLEQQLHPEADPEQRHAGGGALDQRLAQAGPLQVAHRLRERADARQDDRARVAHVGGDHRLGADVRERLLDAAPVAHPVVGDRDHVSVPFVDGTPVSSGSIATAARSARASALKHASIMWCAFVPACRSMCSVSRAALANGAEELLRDLVLEAVDVARRQPLEPADQRVRAAGDVDRAGRAGLVHRHDRVAVADDPAAVAERLVERLPEHDPRVLDRVMGAGLEVAGDLHVEVQPAVAGQQVEHVVEEADAGVRGCPRRCRTGRASARRRSRRSCVSRSS